MIGKIPIWKTLGCIIISISLASCMKSTEAAELNSPYVEAVDSDLIDSDPYEDEVCLKPTPDFAKEAKVDEVITLWNLFFEQANAPISDYRRKSFKTLAECLVEAVEYYQYYETDIGGRLPEDDLAHLVMGTVIYLESSVDPTIVSKSVRHEVGLTQLWGTALGDYTSKEVHENPKLQIVLGTRWLAHQEEVCHTNDWIKLLSSYGAGPKALIKGKGCRSLKFAKYRFYKAKNAAKEIRKK